MVEGSLVEASALPASVGLGRTRIAIGASLLRIRSDEQLVTVFREGNDDAFRVIHDRYRPRLCAYTRQMLAGSGQDPEDAVQEIFMRAYHGLRANNRELALRAWLYRIAHNRCIDELRRPHAVVVEAIDTLVFNDQDPVSRAEQRDALRRLIADVQRLPDQQRSALLMRELSGMTYADVSGALGVSVPAVKSLLVRARVSLAQASEARNTACVEIREDLILSHDRGVRTSGLARRHMRDCTECRQFRTEVRGVNRRLAALAPTLGPLGVIANLLGFGGGSAAGGGAVAGGGAAGSGAAAGAAGSGAVASTGLLAGGATHAVTLLAAAVVTAGGAVALHNTLAAPHHAHHRAPAVVHRAAPAPTPAAPTGGVAVVPSSAAAAGSTAAAAPSTANHSTASIGGAVNRVSPASHAVAGTATRQEPLTMTLDPDNLQYMNATMPGSTTSVANGAAGSPGGATGTASPVAGTGVAGTSSPGATGTGGPVTTGTGSTPTSSPTGGASTTPSSSSSGSTSSTSSSTSTLATAGGAQSTNGPATTASSPSSSSSSSPAATTSSTSGSTSSSAASKSVGSSPKSTNLNKVVATKHRPRHKILVGRLL